MSKTAGSRIEGISAKAIGKSGRVLYAFSHFYLPFYGLAPRDLFRHYDPFAWISAEIYDIDEAVEAGLNPEPAARRLDLLLANLHGWIGEDRAVAELISDAKDYYRFEHDVMKGLREYSFDDISHFAEIRTFDLRIMHRILARKYGYDHRDTLFRWFRAFEILAEVEDDASSVEADASALSFNTLALADRLEPGRGVSFAARLRSDSESAMSRHRSDLSSEERGLADRVFGEYRLIVPKRAWGA